MMQNLNTTFGVILDVSHNFCVWRDCPAFGPSAPQQEHPNIIFLLNFGLKEELDGEGCTPGRPPKTVGRSVGQLSCAGQRILLILSL